MIELGGLVDIIIYRIECLVIGKKNLVVLLNV